MSDLHSEYMEYARERQEKARDRLMAEEIEAERQRRADRYKAQEQRDKWTLAFIALLLIGLVGCLWWGAI